MCVRKYLIKKSAIQFREIKMKKKIPFLIFVVFVSLSFFSNLYAAQTYRLQTPEYSIKTGDDGFHKIFMKGFHTASVSGFPALPNRLYRVAVPPEIIPESIKVSSVREGVANLGEFNIKTGCRTYLLDLQVNFHKS